jgi:hypothetical protein
LDQLSFKKENKTLALCFAERFEKGGFPKVGGIIFFKV